MRGRRWLLGTGLALLLAAMGAGAGGLLLGVGPGQLWQWAGERSPASALRYAEQRLQGHARLEALAAPLLRLLHAQLEREPPARLNDLGKGQRPQGLLPVHFDAAGRPQPTTPAGSGHRPPMATVRVSSEADLRKALERAQPGDIIEVAPGQYPLLTSMGTPRAGTATQPITVRARLAGQVNLVVHTVQGLVVSQPYWVFENLNWQGACQQHSACEHAFHVVGQARGTVIVNNRMADFNAHIKVNGEQGQWPDDGLLQFNSLDNAGSRETDHPVTPVDLVAASGWQVLDNHVTNFAKPDARHPSYGIFMKGGGSGGRIERNLVVCTPRELSRPGLRVGVSLGAGGTDPAACRGQRCDAEHRGGVVANNVVAHCNDVGIDVSQALESLVIHNTLVNTQGIVVRNPPSQAEVRFNVLEGRVQHRAGTQATAEGNLMASDLARWMASPDTLDFRWLAAPDLLPRDPRAAGDFCATPRQPVSPPGATVSAGC